MTRVKNGDAVLYVRAPEEAFLGSNVGAKGERLPTPLASGGRVLLSPANRSQLWLSLSVNTSQTERSEMTTPMYVVKASGWYCVRAVLGQKITQIRLSFSHHGRCLGANVLGRGSTQTENEVQKGRNSTDYC